MISRWMIRRCVSPACLFLHPLNPDGASLLLLPLPALHTAVHWFACMQPMSFGQSELAVVAKPGRMHAHGRGGWIHDVLLHCYSLALRRRAFSFNIDYLSLLVLT